jgi:hypothetical protein
VKELTKVVVTPKVMTMKNPSSVGCVRGLRDKSCEEVNQSCNKGKGSSIEAT